MSSYELSILKPKGETALIIYLIISEGTRAFPPRNLIPVP